MSYKNPATGSLNGLPLNHAVLRCVGIILQTESVKLVHYVTTIARQKLYHWQSDSLEVSESHTIVVVVKYRVDASQQTITEEPQVFRERISNYTSHTGARVR